jgi:Tetrahydrofolate dehydrogenase/cyclohydrolase, catalytic domain
MTTTDTTAKIIDGKLISKQIKDEVSAEVTHLREATGVVPGLAVILVGSRKDSQTYIRNKKKACEAVGIKSYEANLPEDCTESDVLRHIEESNKDPSIHGILVQLPLPRVSYCINLLLLFSILFFELLEFGTMMVASICILQHFVRCMVFIQLSIWKISKESPKIENI